MKSSGLLAALVLMLGVGGLRAGAQQSPASRPAIDLRQALNGFESASRGNFKGLADDWSNHHLIYSQPMAGSAAYEAATRDVRYWQEQIRRARQSESAAAAGAADASIAQTSHQTKRDWSMFLGNGATAGNGTFPAKYSFDISSASCDSDTTPDFVAYNTGLAGSATQPNIVAFDNLYKGCSGTVPLVYWAFNTGTGSVSSSPTLSLDGTKLAFVESSSTNHAILRILQWARGEGSLTGSTWSAHSVDHAINSWSSCTSGSCLISLPFNGNPQSTNSAPFYDFAGDALYVGDDSGVLHKFTPVFSGTPAEVTTGGWPLTVHAASALTSPAFDPNSRNVMVSDSSGRLSYVRETGSTAGACAAGNPPCLGATTIALGGTVPDGPIIDGGTEKAFWFNATTGATKPTLTNTLVQTDIALGNQVTISFPNNAGSAANGNMHPGAFDNLYFNNPQNGHLYVCALLMTARNAPSLYSVGFDSTGKMNSVTTGSTLTLTTATVANECSPLTELFSTRQVTDGNTTSGSTQVTSATAFFTNADIGSAITGTNIPAGTTISAISSASAATLSQASTGTTSTASLAIATDWLFGSVQNNGVSTTCKGGCLYSFSIANAFPTDQTSGLAAAGGTSGISIDNVATSPAGSAEVYYTPLANQTCATSGGSGGCAIQASQFGLK